MCYVNKALLYKKKYLNKYELLLHSRTSRRNCSLLVHRKAGLLNQVTLWLSWYPQPNRKRTVNIQHRLLTSKWASQLRENLMTGMWCGCCCEWSARRMALYSPQLVKIWKQLPFEKGCNLVVFLFVCLCLLSWWDQHIFGYGMFIFYQSPFSFSKKNICLAFEERKAIQCSLFKANYSVI